MPNAAPNLVLLPSYGSPGSGMPVPPLPSMQARVDRIERDRLMAAYGDLGAARLTSILKKAQRGEVDDYYDLCEFFLLTDPALASCYSTRIDRVAQADFVIVPETIGNQIEAQKAAQLVNDCMPRIENWEQAKRWLLHAIAPGYSCCENMWAYDEETCTNYVKRLTGVHGHRFRYDEQWELRLYDRGAPKRVSKASLYGEALPANKWTIHDYQLIAGYPGQGGLMSQCLYYLVFMRWVEKYWIGYVEKNGGPTVYAEVPGGTPEATRNQILSDLVTLTSDRVGVFELPSKLVFDATAAAAKSYEAYKDYKKDHRDEIAMHWLGATDISDPGAHGSQAAVDTRASVTTDPRMVTDAGLFGDSLRRTLFKQLIAMNPHKFAIPVDRVPLPKMRIKTADDEVRQDPTGRAHEIADEQAAVGADGKELLELGPEGGEDEPEAPPPPKPSAKSEGGSVESLLEILEAVTASRITRDAAHELLLMRGVSEERCCRMLGAAAPERAPKAPAPARPGPSKTTTRATSTRSPSPFAKGLRSGSDGSGSSSSRRPPQQLKL